MAAIINMCYYVFTTVLHSKYVNYLLHDAAKVLILHFSVTTVLVVFIGYHI